MSDPLHPSPSDDSQDLKDLNEANLHAPAVPASGDGETAAPVMFSSRPEESAGFPKAAWGVAALVVVMLIVGLMVATRHKAEAPTNTVLPLAAEAASLPLSGLAMSESESLSGGKSTFIDGHIKNNGSQTVTAVTVQVLFANDEAMPPQLETVPLALIRTREPYVDTQPVGAAPLKPGDDREFRLIFESIPQNWNTQMPEVRVVRVSTR